MSECAGQQLCPSWFKTLYHSRRGGCIALGSLEPPFVRKREGLEPIRNTLCRRPRRPAGALSTTGLSARGCHGGESPAARRRVRRGQTGVVGARTQGLKAGAVAGAAPPRGGGAGGGSAKSPSNGQVGLQTRAANRDEIPNFGRYLIRCRGNDVRRSGCVGAGFIRRV